MTVVGGAFLVAVGRTDAGIHVEDHVFRRFTIMDPVDPCTGQVDESGNVFVGAQELSLEASHLAGRCRLLGDGMTADDPSHGRITPETVGVVYIFVTAEPSERRLTEQAGHPMLTVLAGPGIDQMFLGNLGQSESVIEFPKGKEAPIRRDLRTMELQLQTTVKIEPQNPGFTFTRRVSHSTPSIWMPIH